MSEVRNTPKKSRVDLICPTCSRRTDVMWTPLYCDACWYVIGGGDQAPDEHYAVGPFATLVGIPRLAA